MVVRDIMETEVVSVPATDSVRRAGEVMLEMGFAALPVVDAEGALVGIILEEDVLGAAIPGYVSQIEDLSFLPKSDSFPWPGRADLDALRVGQLMRDATPQVIGPDEPILEAARIMLSTHVRRCLVVEDGKLVGIVGRSDLMEIIVRPALEGTS